MITDMLDMGTELGTMIFDSSKQGVYVSVIGVGIDFNTELKECITKNEGSNYFCITKNEQMQKILVDHFHYSFFPCAFNCILRIESDTFEVEKTYGSPFDDTFLEGSDDVIEQFKIEKGLDTKEKEK